MIKDKLENAQIYYGLSKDLEIGLKWLENSDLTNLSDGRYNISDRIYANIQTYETKEDALYEAHRNYIDIQYIVKGEEKIGVTNYNNCETATPYDKEKDIEFLNNMSSEQYIPLYAGEFMLLYPQDAHKPSIRLHKKSNVKKVVVKVKV